MCIPRLIFLLAAALVPAAAHDMWLVANVPGADKKICARIGETFPGTVNAPTADRVTSFQFYSSHQIRKLEGTFGEKQFCAELSAGDGVAEIVVHPRLNEIDAKRFADFVRMEGLESVVQQHRVASAGSTPVRYLYSRYSKAIVGLPGQQQITKPLGHVLEIVPQVDPASLPDGAVLPVLVLFKGKPLANVQVAAVHEGASGEAGTFPVVTRTNDRGIAELRLTRPGLWYARLIYTIPANDPEFEWHHFFATLTFHVGGTIHSARISTAVQTHH